MRVEMIIHDDMVLVDTELLVERALIKVRLAQIEEEIRALDNPPDLQLERGTWNGTAKNSD